LAGENFGCGSSREHAPWALLDFGFRVIISTHFADIFKNNALKNGLLVIELAPEFHSILLNEAFSAIEIKLDEQKINCAGQCFPFEIDPFRKNCLLNGQSDLDVLLSYNKEILLFEESCE
jgi:3-isopropylmalate/(R)-2-methylmalate dehydratase small subunit